MDKPETQDAFEFLKTNIGCKLKGLRIDAGYNSYEVFAFNNKISRTHYWKMVKGTNCTLKNLKRVLDIHGVSMNAFFKSLF